MMCVWHKAVFYANLMRLVALVGGVRCHQTPTWQVVVLYVCAYCCQHCVMLSVMCHCHLTICSNWPLIRNCSRYWSEYVVVVVTSVF